MTETIYLLAVAGPDGSAIPVFAFVDLADCLRIGIKVLSAWACIPTDTSSIGGI